MLVLAWISIWVSSHLNLSFDTLGLGLDLKKSGLDYSYALGTVSRNGSAYGINTFHVLCHKAIHNSYIMQPYA